MSTKQNAQAFSQAVKRAKTIRSQIENKAFLLKTQKQKAYSNFLTQINNNKNLTQSNKADLADFLNTYLNQITI